MKNLLNIFKRDKFLNKTVIHFSTHGCMANIEEFEWIGKIVGKTYPKSCDGKLFYQIKVLKCKFGELRNTPKLEPQFIEIPSWYIQNLGENIYIIYD